MSERLRFSKPVKLPAKVGVSPTRARKMQRAAPRRPISPLERAQKLIEKAMATVDPERQFELAQEALVLSQDCADAYTILSRFLADRRQALVLLEQGLKAAERALGTEKLSSLIGKYWRTAETRPYMRARLALAECLWNLGVRHESVKYLAALLEVNPTDEQGVRYKLAAHLLELNQDADFDALIKQHDEPTTFILFSKLLREFRRGGDSQATRKLLAKSIRRNPYVVPLLLGNDPLPDHAPASYLAGSRSEAVMYVGDLAHAWKQTPGAITWLRQAIDRASARKHKAVGPTAAVKRQLTRVPQNYDTIWQAVVSRLPTWLREGDRMIRPWSILIVDHSAHKILGQEVVSPEPDAAVLFDFLARTMRKPQFGAPQRPSEIQVRDKPVWNAVQLHLEEIGVDCIYQSELETADFIHNEMQGVMRPEQPPALVEIENFDSSQGASFYRAAADFFRRAPWQRVPSDAAVQVDCPQLAEFGPSRWYAVVLGQGGQTYGLALYSQLCDIQSIRGGCCSVESEGALQGTALSILYGEAWEVPIDDMLAAERHHWPLAGPEAYPFILCTEVAMQTRRARPWELQLLEACVRAVADFVEQHRYLDKSTADAGLPMSAAKLKFTLSWVEPEVGGCGSDCGECER
jgi:tetratricopeptide (TPR) repeat protein